MQEFVETLGDQVQTVIARRFLHQLSASAEPEILPNAIGHYSEPLVKLLVFPVAAKVAVQSVDITTVDAGE